MLRMQKNVPFKLVCLVLHTCKILRCCHSNVDLSHLVAEIPGIYRKSVVRVINGQTAPDNRYSFAQVSLTLDIPSDNSIYDHQCGGSLVASDMILTAGHCRQWFSEISVDRYDFASRYDTYEVFEAASVQLHPLYDSETYRYDFMLIELDRPMQMTPPVRLNNNSIVPMNAMELTVLGWGITENSDPENPVYPSVLQKGSVSYITNAQCESTIINNKTLYEGEIFPEMMCATSTKGVDACSGDSGGPLFIEGSSEGLDVLVGLVSWGRGCTIYPGVYSRISSGYEWIRQTICYTSIDPPSYLSCTAGERDPKYSSTPSPVPQSQIGMGIPSVPASSGISSGPSQLASTAAPSAVKVSKRMSTVVVEIQLDAASDETAWHILSKDGKIMVERKVGSYKNHANAHILEEIDLPINEEYFFIITDSNANGICCNSGRGWFRLFLKNGYADAKSGNNVLIPLVDGNGEFDRSSRHEFATDISLFESGQSFPMSNVTMQSLHLGQTNAGSGDARNGQSSALTLWFPFLSSTISLFLVVSMMM